MRNAITQQCRVAGRFRQDDTEALWSLLNDRLGVANAPAKRMRCVFGQSGANELSILQRKHRSGFAPTRMAQAILP